MAGEDDPSGQLCEAFGFSEEILAAPLFLRSRPNASGEAITVPFA